MKSRKARKLWREAMSRAGIPSAIVIKSTTLKDKVLGLQRLFNNMVDLLNQEIKSSKSDLEIMKDMERDITNLHHKIYALLNHCDKESGECSKCSKIICPHKDEMHFHHDGCPSCYQDQ